MLRRETGFVCDEPHGTKNSVHGQYAKLLSVEPDGPYGYRGRDSVVGVATGYRLGGPGIELRSG